MQEGPVGGMNCDEAKKCKAGDLVYITTDSRGFRGKRCMAEIVAFERTWWPPHDCNHCSFFFVLRNIGKTKTGGMYPIKRRNHKDVSRVSFDEEQALRGMVFADCLEENGFPEAAEFLRKRFNLSIL